MEVMSLILVAMGLLAGLNIALACGVVGAIGMVLACRAKVDAFEKSTHQVTYINPFSGKMFKTGDGVESELDLGEIPNMSEAEKKALSDKLIEEESDIIQ